MVQSGRGFITPILLSTFGLAMFSGSAMASTTYDISFFTTFGPGPAPSAGSFTWDGSNFSDFTVTWDGLTFDLTSVAGAPDIFDGGDGCDSEGATPAFGFILMTQTATGCVRSNYNWFGQDASPNVFTNASFGFGLFSGGNGSDSFQTIEPSNLTPTQLVQTSGTWSVTAETPEPGTLALLFIGALGVGVKRYRDG